MYYQKIYLPFDGMYQEKESGMFLFPRNDTEHERDKKRIHNMYPETAKRLAPYVEEACDRLEQDGGILYDEYPDQLMMYRVVAGILAEIKKEAETEGMDWSKEKELWMQDMVKLVLYLEVFKRRCRKKPI